MRKYTYLVSLFTLLFGGVFLFSCEKADPEPPLSDQIAGNYTSDYYTAGTIKVALPATIGNTTATARITITKNSDTDVKVVFIFNQTTDGITQSSNSTVPSVSLSKNNAGEITGSDVDGNSITYSNDQVVVKLDDPDPSKVVVIHALRD